MIILPWFDSGGLYRPYGYTHKWMAVRDGDCVTQVMYDPQTEGSLSGPALDYWVNGKPYRVFCTLEQFEKLRNASPWDWMVDDPSEEIEKVFHRIKYGVP